jgi:hypothetical protein
MAEERRRIKQKVTFEERLAEEAIKFKAAAEKEPPGSSARELLLRRARQAETAAHLSDWLQSPELQLKTSMGELMSGYYAYFTGDDGHITSRVTIFAANDEEAKELAKQLVDGHAVELWQEGRKIAAFDPEQ